ncbi:hypothetical protein PVAP13_6KG032900 [Panicum virgatum]|uniref:Uncharacterized protein n=1 Tax=Panicum virgatum TaxID=38727 RepID=A0A8T0R6U7_PANVG|nr:hypothetical protein PVAP13_6KG032900 [Panicum virgatum]
MENSGQDLSSTANHFFSSGDGSAAASVESGWKSYIDYFMEMQQRQKGEASLATGGLSTDDVGRCRSTSEYSGDCGLGASTRLPALVEPSVVSRRLSLKEGWRRKKKVLYDESLEDTATSPISSPKLRDSDANHQRKGSSCDEISHSKPLPSAITKLFRWGFVVLCFWRFWIKLKNITYAHNFSRVA